MGAKGFGETSLEEEIKMQSYVVCLIDILGQKEKLQGWEDFPENGQLNEELRLALKKSVGTVIRLKEMFTESFDDWNTQQKEVHKASDTEHQTISVQQFSDTLVFYSPMATEIERRVTLASLLAIVYACANAMIEALKARVPFRGGIALDSGVYYSECGFYGAALAKAYKLESKIAEYPRVIVDERFLQFAQYKAKTLVAQQGIENEYRILEECLFRDYDNNLCLDYLGQRFYNFLVASKSKSELTEIIYQAYAFVCDEEEKFRVSGNDKLFQRSCKLRSYMDSRLAIWGLGHLAMP